jgi:predicted ribosome quality control (RQC) complex YloA/Tae2 family protein
VRLTPQQIADLSRECLAAIGDAVVQRVNDGRRGELVLTLRATGRTSHLLIAIHDQVARLHLAGVRPPKPEQPTAFAMLLRKHLNGRRLSNIEPIEGDRVVFLDFERADSPHLQLVAELTGRHGNLFLIDASGLILGSLRANVSHRRKLVAGEPYVSPEQLRFVASAEAPIGSAELERQVEELLAHQQETALRSGLERDLRRALVRGRRREKRVRADLDRAQNSEQMQRWGELLQQCYGKVARGASEIKVPDFYDPGLAMTTVPLNPSLDLAGNIAFYFKQARRFKAALQLIEGRLRDAERYRRSLEELQRAVAEAQSADEVAAIRERSGLSPRPSRRDRRKSKTESRRLPYREFVSATGRSILVGRGARDNDQLTFRIARGRDLWLHADGAAGSHVIVRLDKGAAIDSESLIDAATLAAHYSKLKRDTRIDVRYALQKNVKKPKGAPAGQVTVAQGKIITVRIEPKRLERLFA